MVLFSIVMGILLKELVNILVFIFKLLYLVRMGLWEGLVDF